MKITHLVTIFLIHLFITIIFKHPIEHDITISNVLSSVWENFLFPQFMEICITGSTLGRFIHSRNIRILSLWNSITPFIKHMTSESVRHSYFYQSIHVYISRIQNGFQDMLKLVLAYTGNHFEFLRIYYFLSMSF